MRRHEGFTVVTILDGKNTRCEIRDSHRQVIATRSGPHAYAQAKRLVRQLDETSEPPIRGGRRSARAA